MMAKLRLGQRAEPRIESLEPRILYSADLGPQAMVNEVAVVMSQPAPVAAEPSQSTAQAQQAITEWVVIDARVQDLDVLLADLQSQRDAGRQIGWQVVDATQDGVAAIGALLAGQQSVESLHLVAHGEAGSLLLGRDPVDIATLRARAGEVAAWSNVMTADADLLVYGCDVAAGERGAAFVQALAALTGADVAASLDTTGVLSRGGDWQLEAQTGSIEAAQAFSEQTRDRWGHVLDVVPAGTEVRVNADTSGNQKLADQRGSNQAVALPGGGAFVVWENQSNNKVMGRLISPAGVPMGADIQISSNGFNATGPAVAYDAANNRIVVAWTSGGEDGGGDGVFSRVLDVNGNPLAPVAQINLGTSGNQNQVAVAVNASGLAVFTWTDQSFGSTVSIVSRAIDYTNAIGYSQLVVNNSTGSPAWNDSWTQSNSAVAFADNGEMLVVWESDGQDGDGKGVYGRWFDASLTSKGSEFMLSTSAASDQFAPTVAGGVGGEFVVGWTQQQFFDSVMVRQYNADGTAKGAPIELQPISLTDRGNVSLAMTAGGGFVAAYEWNTAIGDLSNNGVFFGEYSSTGSALGFARVANTTTNDKQEGATVVLSGTSGYVVWEGEGVGDDTGIFLRSYALGSPSVIVTPIAGSTTGESGSGASFSVSLGAPPTANVVVNYSVSDTSEGSVSVASHTFTSANWNVAQTLTVTGVDDTFIDGTQAYDLISSATSSDSRYNSLGPNLTALQNTDDDTRNVIVVTTLADTGGGNVSSIASLFADKGPDGKISLREAIDAANATGNGPGGADIIRFDPALANGVINVGSALPAISQALWIDAITGMSFVDRPMLTLDGNGGGFNGLRIAGTGGNSRVSGLAIVGFGGDGILIEGDSNTIEHNHLGINSAGAIADGNVRGLRLDGSDSNNIRNNLISGNTDNGILVNAGAGNAIEDNLVGVNRIASAVVGNGAEGIELIDSTGNLIRGNTVGGNGSGGIRLIGDLTRLNSIVANFVGTDSGGAVNLGNQLAGIVVQNGADANRIGGVNPTDGNLIRFNNGVGVHVFSGTGVTVDNAILSNRISSNGFGIGLGVTGAEGWSNPPNDPLDTDSGGNGYQNTPVLSAATPAGPGLLLITGQMSGEPTTTYRLQYFASPTANVSGFGEGATYLGWADMTTDGSGIVPFSMTFSYSGAEGSIISATATRYNTTLLDWGDTSPFSANVTVGLPPVWVTGSPLPVNEGLTTVASLSATDPDGPSASIVYSIIGGADSGRFGIVGQTLSFATAPDFEAPGSAGASNNYDLVLRATDVSGQFTDLNLTVQVLNVAEQPVWITPAVLAAPENANSAALLSATDPDNSPPPMVYSIRPSADASLFVMSGNSLQFVTAPDFEAPGDSDGNNVFEVTVRATDAGNDFSERTFFISITNGNEAPVFVTGPNHQVFENTTAIVNVLANDPEQGSAFLTYGLAGGADAARFSIDGITGELRFIAAADFEQPASSNSSNVYQVNVRVVDGLGLQSVQLFNIEVRDTNEPPTIQGPSSLITAEDQAIVFGQSTVPGIVLSDPDAAGAPLLLSIRAESGLLTLGSIQGLVFVEGDGNADAMIQVSGTLNDLSAALAGLRYQPAQDYSGPGRISLAISDPALTSRVERLEVTILINAGDDLPILVRAERLDLVTGIATTLGPGFLEVTDADDAPGQLRFTIEGLPSGVNLTLDGVQLNAGGGFTQADVNAGRLVVVSTQTLAAQRVIELRAEDAGGNRIDNIDLALRSVIETPGGIPPNGTGTGSNGSGTGTTDTTSTTAGSGGSTTASESPGSGSGSVAPASQLPAPASARADGGGPSRPAATFNVSSPSENRNAFASMQRDGIYGSDLQSSPSDSNRSAVLSGSAASRLAMLGEIRRESSANPLNVFRQAEAGTQVSIKAVLQRSDFAQELDRVREQVSEKITLERNVVASSMAVSASLSVGYVIWLIRGGVLLSSLLASIPAWSAIDPLPVLSNGGGKRRDADDDESLEELLSKARRAEQNVQSPDAPAEPDMAESGRPTSGNPLSHGQQTRVP